MSMCYIGRRQTPTRERVLQDSSFISFMFALRPRRRDGLLGTGTEWEGDERVKV